MQRFPSSLASSIRSVAACAAPCAALLFFAGCMTENRSSSGPSYVSDTASVDSHGVRRTPAPKVAYHTHDSLVTVDILGTEYGDQRNYWIYRNGKLLESPYFLDQDSGVYLYRLVDTIPSAGRYAYYVQFGYQKTRLSLKSAEFVYAFPGHTRSGVVSLRLKESQLIQVHLRPAPGEVTGRVRFERKTGSLGEVSALDTVEKSGDESVSWLDPELVPLDTVLYYRAAALDALTEKWWDPTPWDSIRVRNKVWTYIPLMDYRDLGDELEVAVENPAGIRSDKALYRLYRGETPERKDGKLLDSVPMDASASSTLMHYAAKGPDTGYYWLDARDPYGRTSPRSAPIRIGMSGIPKGYPVARVTLHPTVIQIQPETDPDARGYILQRASDTAGSIATLDSVTGAFPGLYVSFTDLPPVDGYWFYRMVSILESGRSSPGAWQQSGYFRRETVYKPFVSNLVNRGKAGVEAEHQGFSGYRFILFRSPHADGSDSVAVDSAWGNDASGTLRDTPAPGTWYYRVLRLQKPSGSYFSIDRSELVRVDFTGRAVGPAITDLDLFGTGIDVSVGHDPDAVAYVLERSHDSSGVWTAFDTVSVGLGEERTVSDHPPKDGFWAYRASSLTRELKLTDPGIAVRTAKSWSYTVRYENLLQSVIANTGPQVECVLTTSGSYGYFLFRSRTSDYAGAVAADTALVGDSDSRLLDVPEKGVWYYWTVRMVSPRENLDAIYRSVPVRVDFTGAPEIISLMKLSNGVRVTLPQATPGDTVEIWRSTGENGDSASFARIGRDWGSNASGTTYYQDQTLDPSKASFYRYRLTLIHAGRRESPGPARIFYYSPD